MYYWCEQRKHKYYGGVWAGQTSKKTITCQHFKDCINTGYLNQCESSGLTGSVFLFKLGSLSRHMKKLHWFLSVSELWQGAVNAAGLQVTDCVRWRIVFAQILCSAFKLPNVGIYQNRRAHVRRYFTDVAGVQLWLLAVWFIHKHRHESKTEPWAVSAVGKHEQKYNFVLSLFPQRPYTCAVHLYVLSEFLSVFKFAFFGWVGVGCFPSPSFNI